MYLMPGLVRLGIMIDFKVNQDYIAEAFCVFKAVPENDCQGMCYLDEQLDKTDEPEDHEQPVAVQIKTEIQQYFEVELFELSSPFLADQTKWKSFQPFLYKSSSVNQVFHPPRFS